jgi:uncharacterized membrane protein YhaH (DUF805 family)
MNDPYGQPGGGYQGGGYPGGGYPGYTPGQGSNQFQQERGYLQGGPVDFAGAIRQQFANVTNFNGRASRSAFWWFWLAGFIVNFVLQIIARTAGSTALSLVVSLIVLAVGLSLAARRLHDSDKSGWWLLLYFIPIIGWIVLLIFYLLPGTPGPNRHG